MILVKVLTSILLLLTFIHALPLTLERVDDTSIQRSNLVVRQTTTTPVSVAATGPESLNSTALVDTFEDLTVDLKSVGRVLQNLTETLERDISNVSMNILHFVVALLAKITQHAEGFLARINEEISHLPNGPLKELFGAVPESLKSLIESLDNLGEALSNFSGNLNSLQSILKALKGALNALIEALGVTIKLVVGVESLGTVPAGDLDKVLNDLTGLSSKLAVLKVVLGVLGAAIGL